MKKTMIVFAMVSMMALITTMTGCAHGGGYSRMGRPISGRR